MSDDVNCDPNCCRNVHFRAQNKLMTGSCCLKNHGGILYTIWSRRSLMDAQSILAWSPFNQSPRWRSQCWRQPDEWGSRSRSKSSPLMRTSLLVLSKSVLWNLNCFCSSSSNSGSSCSLVVVVVVCVFDIISVAIAFSSDDNEYCWTRTKRAHLLTEAKTRTGKQDGEVQKVGKGLWCKHKILPVTNSVFAWAILFLT